MRAEASRLALPVLAAAALAACAPKPPAAQPVQLDCTKPFDALRAQITTQPGLAPAPPDAGEPYRAYSMADGRASYFITEPGAPAHPAILMQQVVQAGAMKNTGCPYGDKAAYAQLMTYLTGLKAGGRK